MATQEKQLVCENELETFLQENKHKSINFVDLNALFQLHYNVKKTLISKTAEFEENLDDETKNEVDLWDLCLDLFQESFLIGNEKFFKKILTVIPETLSCSKEVLRSMADFFYEKNGGEWAEIRSNLN